MEHLISRKEKEVQVKGVILENYSATHFEIIYY